MNNSAQWEHKVGDEYGRARRAPYLFLIELVMFIALVHNVSGGGDIISGQKQWEFMSELQYYKDIAAHEAVGFSVIPAYMQVASYDREYMRRIKELGALMDRASGWILLQEIHVEAGRFRALFVYKTDADRQWRASRIEGEKSTDSGPITSNKQMEEWLGGLGDSSCYDFSKYEIRDGEVAFITVFKGGKLQRFAVYCAGYKSPPDDKRYVFLSSLVSQLKIIAATNHARPAETKRRGKGGALEK